MDIDWQQASALGLVAMAAGYVVWRAWRRVSSRNACAACAGCGDGQAAQDPTIVPIESLTQVALPVRDSDTA